MQKMLNLKVKLRESFRPFAPSVLREDVSDWFELDADSPYMLVVAPVVASRRRRMTAQEEQLFGIDKLNVVRSDIPAVTHVDYSARVQTVHRETNPRYHALISAFKARTGCPVLVNTSFNVRSEPIVYTPEDAFRCFMGTGIEVLAVENCLLLRKSRIKSWRSITLAHSSPIEAPPRSAERPKPHRQSPTLRKMRKIGNRAQKASLLQTVRSSANLSSQSYFGVRTHQAASSR